MNVAEDFQFI